MSGKLCTWHGTFSYKHGKTIPNPVTQSWVAVVMLESLAGTGHKIFRQRLKTAEKLEFLFFDPMVQKSVLYKEKKKVKTLRSKYS